MPYITAGEQKSSHRTNTQAVGVKPGSAVAPLTDIGHSAAISETFMPKVIPSTGEGLAPYSVGIVLLCTHAYGYDCVDFAQVRVGFR